MNRKLLILLFLVPLFSFTQVTTSPTIPIITGEIIVIFDATGTPLENYSGIIYAHTGVTVNGAQWQNVIESWGNNSTQPALTNTSENIYEFTITPDIYGYYGVGTSDTITELSFVFRSADGNTQSTDVFIDVFEAGLNVAMTNPSNGDTFNLNDVITLSAESSINADLELFVNNISQQTTTNTTSISTSYTFTSAGNHAIKVTATQGADNDESEISVYVKSPTLNEPLPTGVKSGYNNNGDGTITFVLLAPNKTDIFLIGDFNNWVLDSNFQLKKDGDYFWVTVNGLDPDTEYAYQYYIDFNIKIADPYAAKILDPWNDQYIPDSTYPNLKDYPTNKTTGIVSTFKINETEYSWQNTSFTKPDQENLIIYEMLVRDFTDNDTYKEAMTHLDYLQDLGVNAIELMPVNEFEGNDSWGYNPSFYMALDKAYGTKNDFKKFVDACHQRGIAVLTDVVFNHSYGQSPLLQMYWNSASNIPAADSPFYNEHSNLVDNTSAHWGYDFNHESDYTVNFFNDVLTYWMDEYNIDGFRFDFTKGLSNTIYTGSNNWASAYDAARIQNLKAFADHVWANDPGNEAYVIFEHLSENTEETELANYGIMLWGNMNHSFNQNTMGYDSETDISWLSYQNRGWNNPHVVGYMESHDEERLMVKNLAYGNSDGNYDVTDLNTALNRQEAATAIFYGIPGPKMIWQFGELGYDKSINCENDISDGSCRLDRKPTIWSLGYDTDEDRLNVFDVTAKMIELKKEYPSTFNTDDYSLDVSGLVKRINLYDNVGDLDVVIIANFDVTTKSVNPNFPSTGVWYRVFNGSKIDVTNTSEMISLQPGEYQIYSTSKLNDFEFSLEPNNFEIEVIGETCIDKSNGQITITANEVYNYTATIDGTDYDFTTSLTVDNLDAGAYTICITLEEEPGYEQCFGLIIEEAEEITGKSSSTKTAGKATEIIEITSGTAPYTLTVNGIEVQKTNTSVFSVDVAHGDKISISSKFACEGKFEKNINLIDDFIAYPNPTNGRFDIAIPNIKNDEVVISVYNMQQQLVSQKSYKTNYGNVSLSLDNKPSGMYFAVIKLESPITLKIIKQ